MKYLILLLLLLSLTPVQAQTNKATIAPCLPEYPSLIRAEYEGDDFSPPTAQVIKNISTFYELEGEYIGWLGYAPKGEKDKEWLGIEYGFEGIDMRKYGEQFLILIYDNATTFSKRKVIGRIEVHEYDNTHHIFFFTNLYANTDRNGEHMGFHIFSDPRNNGEACMFLIGNEDYYNIFKGK